jgi:hypothetical protein
LVILPAFLEKAAVACPFPRANFDSNDVADSPARNPLWLSGFCEPEEDLGIRKRVEQTDRGEHGPVGSNDWDGEEKLRN